MQSRIADLEAQVDSLSMQNHAVAEEHHSSNKRINTLAGTLALRNQQLIEANIQLAQVSILST